MGRVVIPGFRKIETGGGGEGTTSNYEDLANKPSINGVPLTQGMSGGDLHLTNEQISESLSVTGDTANNIVSFTSADAKNPTQYTDVDVLATGETHKSIFAKISTMFKNIRYLYKMLGTTDISSIGDGTATGAISTLNSNLNYIYGKYIGNFRVKINESATSPAIPEIYNGLRLYFYDGNNGFRQSVIVPMLLCNIPYMSSAGIQYVTMSINSNRTVTFTNKSNSTDFVVSHMYAIII